MRNGDFPKKVKAEALRRSGFRCERCWNSQNLEFHHRVPIYQGGVSVLKMFMKFASPKEMITYCGVKTEVEAIET
ncbi:MAG: hypothetical protein ABH874_01485 [Methanobacteriota archaeon]